MSLDTDKYLMKRFDRDRYNCWDFVREIWAELTGIDVFTTVPPTVDSIAPRMTEISKPEDPCLVLMMRKKCTPHVGVYYRGRVLHMNQRGAEYSALDSATACFTAVRYYK